MSTSSPRWRRDELYQQKAAHRRAARTLRQREAAHGLKKPPTATISNGKSEWATVEEEQQARRDAIAAQIKVYRSILPILLKRLAKIPDARNPKTTKHKVTVLMLYGILAFVFQMASRREANRQMSLPMFQQNLRLLFPELETVPHQDTLNRLLSSIDVDQIEAALLDLIQRFIRKKKFYRYLVSTSYPIAIDGTQKLVRRECWAEEWLERQVQQPGGATAPQYYVYVLESHLAFSNGMTIPLLTEFLSDAEGDRGRNKQDCEQKAFFRLARRLKERFPRLPILVLLDGLYATGPVIALCRGFRWQFMIVLQDASLPSVWEDARGLETLQPTNRSERCWGNRRQRFRWVNGIEYCYGINHRKHQVLHVVMCEERWEEVARDSAEVVQKTSRHAWISSEPLSRENIHERCNLAARHRWGIENSFLMEKRHGYQYEHGFSQNWNAMRGYHFLMRLGHLINILAQNTASLARIVRSRGIRGMIQFVRETCSGPWLDADWVRQQLRPAFQLRLE